MDNANNILLKEDKIQFQKEQDELLKTLLEYRFFKPWRNECTLGCNGTSMQADSHLELYLTSTCNQHCEYCYLVKYPDLYPKEANDPELIKKNLCIFLDYVLENKFYIPEVEVFSGEIWHSQLGFDVLEILLDYCKKSIWTGGFLVPSNCSFAQNPETRDKIQHYINEFNKIGCYFRFSISVDGKYVDNGIRPRNSKVEYTDEFYDELFVFAKRNGFCFHPMLSSASMPYWEDNFKWWKERHEYYNMDFYKTMFLEVRNSDWTDESIQQLCALMDQINDDILENVCKGNIETYANMMAMIRNAPVLTTGYTPWFIQKTDTMPCCGIGICLTVRLGDLAICPCHRTAYNKYLYGYYQVKDGKIVDIKAQNTQMATQVLMTNILVAQPGCDTCMWNECCLHGCFGHQIEVNKDPFFPSLNVCKMLSAKYSHLMKYYKDKGIIDYYKKIGSQELGSNSVMHILTMYERWEAFENGMGAY